MTESLHIVDSDCTSDDLDLGPERGSLHADPGADLDHEDLPPGGRESDGVDAGQVRELLAQAPQLLLQSSVGVILLPANLRIVTDISSPYKTRCTSYRFLCRPFPL